MASYKTSNASVYVPATVAPKPATSAISKTYSAPPPASSPVSAKTPLPNITLGQTAPYKAGQTPGPSTTTYYSGSTPITAPLLTAQQPVNLTTGSFGGGSVGVGTTGTGGSGAGITGGTLGYNASVAGSIGNEYTRDANGNWVLNQQDPNAKVDNIPDYIKQNIPQRESLYAQPEYQQAQQQFEQARQRQRQYSDQIATITNIANAKALSLQGQGRGIPEAIIGGQQAQIYKEAAIQALPIQSQLAIAQGDTEAAQEHLNNLTKYLTEAVNNKFESDKMRYTAVSQYMTEKEKQYTTQLLGEKKALTDAQNEAFDMLAKAGITSSEAYSAIRNARSVEQVAMVKARYGGRTTSSTGVTGTDGKPLSAAQATAKDQVNTVLASLESYKNLYNAKTSALFRGINLTGKDAGELRAAYNTLMFQIAQAAGTGALQAADRQIVESMLPNPTSFSGALGGAFRGGKAGGLAAIEQVKSLMQNKLNAIGGATVQQGVLISPDGTQQVNAAELTPAQLQEARDNGWK